MDDPSNQLVLSVASTWEMVIKASTGRLRLDRPALAYIEHYITLLSLEILPVTLQHAFAVAPLPSHHGDPFDRMLVAQATIEGLPIITGDMAIRHYDIETIW